MSADKVYKGGGLVRMGLVVAITMVMVMTAGAASAKPPNIVFILTDDQDLVLGGMDPMSKTTNLIGKQGITFKNAFVSVPICCPSRSSILTGKFLHNHQAYNNSVEGGCSSISWQTQQEPEAFPVYLKKQNYTTFYAGKYLNRYGYNNVGGTAHVPPGWDWWYGLVGNSVYYNYTLSVNGKSEIHGDDYLEDYLTDLINRKGQEFLHNQHRDSAPFFMMLSTPACHEPFPPAPHYAHYYSDQYAPRNHGSFNVKAKDKHWLMEQPIIPMPNDTINLVDDFFRNRQRTLLSVDDLVEDVYNVLRAKGLLDNTYIFFTSDHGYHLGQFGLPYDKREPYEFDIRVPMMVKGPGIRAGLVSEILKQLRKRKKKRKERRRKRREKGFHPMKNISESPMNIDLGPTFISLAGGPIPAHMDGKSMEPLWTDLGTFRRFRDDILIEYSGEEKPQIRGCPQLAFQRVANCNPKAHCVCEDSHNNTWACVRSHTGTSIYKYCEFEDDANFQEMYNLNADPWELTNLATRADTDRNLLNALRAVLHRLQACTGASCNRQTQDLQKILKEAKKGKQKLKEEMKDKEKEERRNKRQHEKMKKKESKKKKKQNTSQKIPLTGDQLVALFSALEKPM